MLGYRNRYKDAEILLSLLQLDDGKMSTNYRDFLLIVGEKEREREENNEY